MDAHLLRAFQTAFDLDLLAEALAAATGIASEHSRAQALAGLAPHLPPDLLAEALTAATGIASEHSRAQALAGLAPHLPGDLLARALAATPQGYAEIRCTLVERGQTALAASPKRELLGLLRSSFSGQKREVCLAIISVAVQSIFQIGGESAVEESVNAIADIWRWWP